MTKQFRAGLQGNLAIRVLFDSGSASSSLFRTKRPSSRGHFHVDPNETQDGKKIPVYDGMSSPQQCGFQGPSSFPAASNFSHLTSITCAQSLRGDTGWWQLPTAGICLHRIWSGLVEVRNSGSWRGS